MTHLPCKQVQNHDQPDAAVIWLHGLGATNDDFVPIVPELKLGSGLKVRFIFPQAPSMPVTVNGGMVMPAWYDIFSIDIDRKIDVPQIFRSASQIQDLIDREIQRGIASQRIVLAGFSQGGAVAYQAALSKAEPLAGLLALSTYLATAPQLEVSAANSELPIMIQHGVHDPVVPESLGREAQSWLAGRGLKAQYQTYPMQHELCMPQVDAISACLNDWLPAGG